MAWWLGVFFCLLDYFLPHLVLCSESNLLCGESDVDADNVLLHGRLRALAAEVTRVTLEVGSQGKLGGQAHVPDVEGVWFELVRNVRKLSRIMGVVC